MSEKINTYFEIKKDDLLSKKEWNKIKKDTLFKISDFSVKLRNEYNKIDEKFKKGTLKEIVIKENELLLLKEIFKDEIKLKKSIDYFTVDGESIMYLDKEILEEFGGLKIGKMLSGYMNYIDKNLSNLSIKQINKVKLSIIRKFNSLDLNKLLESKKKKIKKDIKEVIKKREETIRQIKKEMYFIKNSDIDLNHKDYQLSKLEMRLYYFQNMHIPELRDYRWIVNEEIQDRFDFINDELLPSLAYYSKNYENIKKYINGKDNAFIYRFAGNELYHVEDVLNEIDELLNAPIDKKGNFYEGFFSTQRMFNIKNRDKRILEKHSILKVGGVDVLSEEDKEMQAKVMATYIAYVMIMIIPYAGDLASLPADVRNLITDKEGTLQTLKDKGLVPQNFQMQKELYDYVFGALGIIGTIITFIPQLTAGGQAIKKFIKGEKMAEIYKTIERLGISSLKFSEMVNKSFEQIKGSGIYRFVKNGINTSKEIYNTGAETIKFTNQNFMSFFGKALKDSSIGAYHVFLKSEIDGIIKRNEINSIINTTSNNVAYLLGGYYLNPSSLLKLKTNLEKKGVKVKIINDRYYSKASMKKMVSDLHKELKNDKGKEIILFGYSTGGIVAHRIGNDKGYKSVSFGVPKNPEKTMVGTLLSLTKKGKFKKVSIPDTGVNIIETFSAMVPNTGKLDKNTIRLKDVYSHMTIGKQEVIDEITKQVLLGFSK